MLHIHHMAIAILDFRLTRSEGFSTRMHVLMDCDWIMVKMTSQNGSISGKAPNRFLRT